MNSKKTLFFAILFVLFSLLSLWDTRHPISQGDENIFIHNINCIRTHNFQNALGPVIRVFETVPFVLFSQYHVCIDQYIYLPLAAIVDPHIAIRVVATLMSLLTLWVCFLFMESFIDRRAAYCTITLLAFHSAFIMGTRFSVLTGSPILLVALLALHFLWKWYTRKGEGYLWTAMLLLGFGCTIRIIFLSFILALFILAAFNKGRLFSRMNNSKELAVKYGRISLLLFLLGAFPLVYYNLTEHAGTLRFLFDKITARLPDQGSSSYPAYILNSLQAFVLLLKGNYVTLFPVERTFFSIFSNGLYPPVFIVSCLWFLYSIFGRKTLFSRRMLFIFALFLLIFMQFFIPKFNFYPHHYFIALPFVCMIIAIPLSRWTMRSRPFLVTLGSTAVFLALIGTDVILISNKYYCARRYGYSGHESNAVYALTEWLGNTGCRPVILDRDTADMALIDHKGTVKPEGLVFEDYLNYPDFKNIFSDKFNDPRSVYVFYCDDKTFYRLDKSSLFYTYARRLADEKGKAFKEIKYFWQPNGRLVYFAARLDTL